MRLLAVEEAFSLTVRGAPMTTPVLVNLSSLLDDAKCFELIRQHRWSEGVRCPHCDDATAVARDGHDDTQPHCQRYRCTARGARFDDLSGTVLAGHHQPRESRPGNFISETICAA